MIKVSFVNDWGGSVQSVLESLRYYTPGHDNQWGDLRAVESPEDADYLIVLNGLPRNSGGPAKRMSFLTQLKKRIKRAQKKQDTSGSGKIFDDPEAAKAIRKPATGITTAVREHPAKIFFQMEPPEIRRPNITPEETLRYCGYETHHHVANWHIRLPFQELKELEKPEDIRRLRPLSAVVSSKQSTPAQKKRLEVVRSVAALRPDMDLFGRGLTSEEFGTAYKGALDTNGHCKLMGLYEYRYSLAFENSSHPNYFTEKLIDCFLCWCKPIYWGCTNIDEFFPKESLAKVDIFAPGAPEQILEEISKPVDYDALNEARNRVLYDYNIWASIEKQICDLRSL